MKNRRKYNFTNFVSKFYMEIGRVGKISQGFRNNHWHTGTGHLLARLVGLKEFNRKCTIDKGFFSKFSKDKDMFL